MFTLCFFTCQSQIAVGVAKFSRPRGTSSNIRGTITFTQDSIGDPVTVVVDISGITTAGTGLHGIHVHAYGDLRGYLPNSGSGVAGGLSNEIGLSTGPHYDPANTQFHSCAEVAGLNKFHMGDLGNWNRTGGSIRQTKVFTTLSLRGDNSIIGRGIVLHEGPDDCTTQPNGNSGSRIAAAVIGIANVAGNSASVTSAGSVGVCVLEGTSVKPADLGAIGVIQFSQRTNPQAIGVIGRVVTGDTLEHGFHVHTFGDLTGADGLSTGPHLNPDNQLHSLPGITANRHLGDFGAIRSYDSNGNGYYNAAPSDYTPASSLIIDNFIGRGVIIHETLDHGNTPSCTGSDANGAAGSRWSYCVIGVANPNTDSGANLLEVPSVPSGVNIDNRYSNTPCNAPTTVVAPTTNNAPTPTVSYNGLSGGAVVGILIALFFVLIVLAICIACLCIKVICK